MKTTKKIIHNLPVYTLALGLVFGVAHCLATTLEVSKPLTIDECFLLAEQFNPDVIAARQALTAAKAGQAQADVRPNAQVSGFSNPTLKGQTPFRQADVTLRIDQTFERGQKRQLRINTAQALITAASFDVQDSLRLARLTVAAAYVDFKSATDRAALLNSNKGTSERLADAADKRVKAGDLAAVEAARIRTDAIRAANDAEQAALEAEVARNALALLTGTRQTEAKPWLISNTWDELISAPASTDNESMANRSDIAAAMARQQAAHQLLDLAKSQRTRDLTLSAQAERSPSLGGMVIGVGLGLPIFNGNNFSGDIERAASDATFAETLVNRAVQMQQSDIAKAQAQWQSSQLRLKQIREKLLPLALRSANALEIAYQKGGASLTDLLDARRQAIAAQLEQVNALADAARSTAQVQAAFGQTSLQPNQPQ